MEGIDSHGVITTCKEVLEKCRAVLNGIIQNL
jgi:hypothetical protein